jgi:phosphoribosylanthranilate isomerase
MIKVKICGIRTIEQAQTALGAGADFIGLQFVPTSKRKIEYSVAKEISKKFKEKIKLVGVFQNQTLDEINRIVKELKLDYVQLHGEETNTFCNTITVPVIKAFRPSTFHEMKNYSVPYHLIDREKRGEGKMFPLKKSKRLARDFRLFIAGGLDIGNVSEVIKEVRPFAVDVASGIETDGVPDPEKIQLFVKNVKKIN